MNPMITSWLTSPDGLSTRLRTLRDDAGLTGKDLADAAGWDPPRVSKLELGKQLPTESDVRRYVDLCGAAAHLDELLKLQLQAQSLKLTFKQRMANGQATVQRSYNDLVANSTVIREFDTAYVPGLLQVPDYARRVLAESHRLHELEIDDVEAAVGERMQRQRLLYDPSKRFEFLLAESVLRWLIVPPAAMRAQLDRLLGAIGLPNIKIGVLPFGVELKWTPQHSFQTYDDLALVETFFDEVAYEGADGAQFSRVMSLMWEEALSGDDARRLIVAAMSALPAH